MSPPNLKILLQDIATHLKQLLDVLGNENKALADNNTEAIHLAAQNKTLLTDGLEELEQERHNLLRQAGLDLDTTGVMAYLQRAPHHDKNELQGLWREIENLTRQCRQQNQINGIVLEKNRRRTETALAILKGQAQDAELYTASGAAVNRQRSQSLAKA